MATSLRTGFAQIFSRCTKNLSCSKFGGAAARLAPPGPYAYAGLHDKWFGYGTSKMGTGLQPVHMVPAALNFWAPVLNANPFTR